MNRPDLTINKYNNDFNISNNNIISGGEPIDGFNELNKNIKWFYDNFIQPNTTTISIITILIIFLIIKYYISKVQKENIKIKKEQFSNIDDELDLLIDDHHTDNYHINNQQHTFNPYNPQNNKDIIQHPQMPLRLNDDLVVPSNHSIANHNMMPAGNINQHGNRDYMIGMNNPYQGAEDTQILNPYGWNNDFNTSTNRFTSDNAYMNNYMQHQMDENNHLLRELMYGNNYNMPNNMNFLQNIEPPYEDVI